MNKLLLLIIIVLVVISLAGNIYLLASQPRLGYVRSYDLVEKYQGTQEARAKFEQKKTTLMANVDSLKLTFEKDRIAYLSGARAMTSAQRRGREESLGRQQSQIVQYSAAVEEQIAQEDNDKMAPVLAQINTCVEEYAKEKDFDFIFGTTLSGSLLYGKNSIDVTDDILQNLNAKYKGH